MCSHRNVRFLTGFVKSFDLRDAVIWHSNWNLRDVWNLMGTVIYGCFVYAGYPVCCGCPVSWIDPALDGIYGWKIQAMPRQPEVRKRKQKARDAGEPGSASGSWCFLSCKRLFRLFCCGMACIKKKIRLLRVFDAKIHDSMTVTTACDAVVSWPLQAFIRLRLCQLWSLWGFGYAVTKTNKLHNWWREGVCG